MLICIQQAREIFVAGPAYREKYACIWQSYTFLLSCESSNAKAINLINCFLYQIFQIYHCENHMLIYILNGFSSLASHTGEKYASVLEPNYVFLSCLNWNERQAMQSIVMQILQYWKYTMLKISKVASLISKVALIIQHYCFYKCAVPYVFCSCGEHVIFIISRLL